MERPNLAGDAKGKDTSGHNRKVESTDAPERADCLVLAMKRGNGGGAKGAGHRHWIGSTRNGKEPDRQWKAAAFMRWHEPYESAGSMT